jgi:hypothetical protein
MIKTLPLKIERKDDAIVSFKTTHQNDIHKLETQLLAPVDVKDIVERGQSDLIDIPSKSSVLIKLSTDRTLLETDKIIISLVAKEAEHLGGVVSYIKEYHQGDKFFTVLVENNSNQRSVFINYIIVL